MIKKNFLNKYNSRQLKLFLDVNNFIGYENFDFNVFLHILLSFIEFFC